MESASLRIRFTPLFKNALKNDSKCCLEIVPEVSCVENLDKISWKTEKNLIEYTVPMTYKIILKKREIVKNKNEDQEVLEKTYHSCVDLLPSSSMTGFDFASGDVTRITSDSYIMEKIMIDSDKILRNNYLVTALKSHVTELQERDYKIELPVVQQKENETAVFVDDERADNVDDNENSNPHKMRESDVTDKHSLNKITNTENYLGLSKDTDTQSIETITEVSTRSQDDPKRKLSLSPICSIDTNDNPFPEAVENKPLKSLVDQILQYKKEERSANVGIKFPIKNDKHFGERRHYELASKENLLHTVYRRELPEARVAKFIKIMENEIMPLKMMLNDIILKCSTLGLNKNKHIARNFILYKTVPGCGNQVEKYCKTERQTKSNRVVYSIVFDG